AELLQWEAFSDALTRITDEGTKQVLTWLRDLFGLGLIEKHVDWYLITGRISGQRAEAVTAYIDRLIDRVTDHALDLVAAFGLDNELLRADIASGIEAERQHEATTWVQQQKEAGKWPVHEKELRAKSRNR